MLSFEILTYFLFFNVNFVFDRCFAFCVQDPRKLATNQLLLIPTPIHLRILRIYFIIRATILGNENSI